MPPWLFGFASTPCVHHFPTITTKWDYHWILWTLSRDTKWIGKTKSSEAICAVVTNSQREETLRAIRIVSLLRNLTNCCKTELWVKDGVLGPNPNKKGDRVDLLTVVPAIAIPTIPTRCRLASITLWISTRQFYSKQNRKIFTPRKTAQLCQLFSLSSRRTQKGLLHSLP